MEQKNRFNTKNLIDAQRGLNEENLDFLVDNGLVFMKNYGNIFKILLTELLKCSSKDIDSFEVFNSILHVL